MLKLSFKVLEKPENVVSQLKLLNQITNMQNYNIIRKSNKE